ncbi:MAG: hypothetical protein EXS49_01025 [Candidatus Pacebacteria bacterium]|nr:hypothetical protein [Candidatus Paceibacterota bacterium]
MLKNKKGQSILEILIAVGIAIVSISAGSMLFFGNQTTFLDQRNYLTGSGLTSECIEASKEIYNRDWNELTAGSHGMFYNATAKSWSYASSSSDVSGIFTRIATISTTSISNIKDLKCTVSWSIDPDRPQHIDMYYKFSNSLGLYGDWSNPRTFGAIDLGAGNEGTDLSVRNKIVYMTTKASSGPKLDFHVVDATNPASPFIVKSINTGIGLMAIDVYGDYAYVASESDVRQFQIINIATNNNPFLVSSSSTSGNGEEGLSVAYSNGYAFVGIENSISGPELTIFNVSNPASPTIASFYEIGGDLNQIFLKDNYAYLITSLNNSQIIVLDVSNPASPIFVTKYDVYGNMAGKSIDIIGNLIYYGSNNEPDPNGREFYILDSLNFPTLTSTGTANINADLNDVYVKDYLAFMATGDTNNEFMLYDISNVKNITLISTLNFPQGARAIDYESNYVYVAVKSNDSLRIISSQ